MEKAAGSKEQCRIGVRVTPSIKADEPVLFSGLVVNVDPKKPKSTLMSCIRFLEFKPDSMTLYCSANGYFTKQAHQATNLDIKQDRVPFEHALNATFILGAVCTSMQCGNVNHLRPYSDTEEIQDFFVKRFALNDLPSIVANSLDSQGFEAEIEAGGISRELYLRTQRHITMFDCENVEFAPSDLHLLVGSGVTLFGAVFSVVDPLIISLCRLRGYANHEVSENSAWSLIFDVSKGKPSVLLDDIYEKIKSMTVVDVKPDSLKGYYP